MNVRNTLAAVLALAALIAVSCSLLALAQTDAEDSRTPPGMASLSALSIPDTATSISEHAFRGCDGLEYVTVPSSVVSIGPGAFSGCASLRSLTFSGSGDMVLEGGSAIFDDPEGVTIINALGGRLSISAGMVGGKGIDRAEPGAAMVFEHGEWTEAYVFSFDGDSVSKVSSRGSYSGVLTIPSNVSVVCGGSNSQMFGFDKSWVESVRVPFGVTAIGNNAFSGCSSMVSVEIPPTVTSIGSNAFSSCSSLKSIDLPEGLRTLGRNAFANCRSIESVAVPAGVSDISAVFSGCTGLLSASLPSGLKDIGESAFYGCAAMRDVGFPDRLESVSGGAFFGCASLTSLTLPDSVRAIGERAFEGCRSLAAVDLSDGLESIGQRAFASCSSLETMEVPPSTGVIGKEAFSNSVALKTISIKRTGVLQVGDYAFPLSTELDVDFYGEDGSLLTSNYYKRGTFEYSSQGNPGFHRVSP